MPDTNHPSRIGVLRWIAIFKFAKAALMIAVGVGLFKMVHHNTEDALNQFVSRLGIDPDRGLIDKAIGKLVSIPSGHLKEFGFGSFLYAALFLTEGIGLWQRKRWAEWFTSILTASLIPLEVYELAHHPSAGKVIVLLLNIAIVVYLLLRIRSDRRQSAA